MILLGLTGSIGMGKSAAAEAFRAENIPVYDADAAVHEIYQPGGSAVEPVGALFPDVIVNGGIDRNALRAHVVNNPAAMIALEEVVHPLVGETQLKFRKEVIEKQADIAVLDIPLLFETGGDQRVDYVVVVTTTAEEQRSRVLARDGMTEDVFLSILAKQIPDDEKRKRADFVLNARIDLQYTRDQVRALIAALRRKEEEPSHA